MLIGKKLGMTRLFDESGGDHPVTVIHAGPCYVTQIKTIEKDGYEAMQVGYNDLSEKKMKKPFSGHFKKAGMACKKYLREFPIHSNDVKSGDELSVALLEVGGFVNIAGVSKGRGFAGVMKRHGFGGGRRSHGKNSVMRAPGSVGAGSIHLKYGKVKGWREDLVQIKLLSKILRLLKLILRITSYS